MKKVYFFSMNNGMIEGGATVRMKGLLNALAEKGYSVYFFSNVKDYHNYHSQINHIKLPIQGSPLDKKIIQVSIANLDYKFTNKIFYKWLSVFKKVFENYDIDNLISFEYLDNTIAYWLCKNGIIKNYSNDIHGVAELEFIKSYNSSPIHVKPLFYLKYKSAKKLDLKVISNAKFNIFTSKAMKNYFSSFISNITEQNSIVIPNLIKPENYQLCKRIEDLYKIAPQLKTIDPYKKTLFFVGSFKKISGVIELIKIAKNLEKSVQLIMVGDGHLYKKCQDLLISQNIHNVYLLGRIPYEYLNCFHQLAHIMICPDEDNPFSQMIVHLKYLDALMSNKPVINADFKSVEELNNNDRLSISYPASNYSILQDRIENIINNYDYYRSLYKNNRSIVSTELSYDSYIDKLINEL